MSSQGAAGIAVVGGGLGTANNNYTEGNSNGANRSGVVNNFAVNQQTRRKTMGVTNISSPDKNVIAGASVGGMTASAAKTTSMAAISSLKNESS